MEAFARIAQGAEGAQREGMLVREGCLGRWRVLNLEGQRGIGQEDPGNPGRMMVRSKGWAVARFQATAFSSCLAALLSLMSLLDTALGASVLRRSSQPPKPCCSPRSAAGGLLPTCLPRHMLGAAPGESAVALSSWWRQTADPTTLTEHLAGAWPCAWYSLS